MEKSLEIHIKDKETMRQVVSEGIASILSREFMRDNYVHDVDQYDGETIIYIKEKYSAKLRIVEDVRESGKTHLSLVPRNPQQ